MAATHGWDLFIHHNLTLSNMNHCPGRIQENNYSAVMIEVIIFVLAIKNPEI